MTISSTTSRWAYTGDGVTTAFAYTNRIFAASDLKVYLAGVFQAAGYSLSGVDAATGGSVTFAAAPAAGVSVVLARQVPATQETDYQPNDPFPAETHERALDRLTVLVQQLETRAARALALAEADPAAMLPALPVAAARAGRVLAFDAVGTPIAGELLAGPAGSFLAAGAGAVPRSYLERGCEHLSVKDFGAAGDGVADETAALQAALAALPAAGGRLYLPAGRYRVSAPLVLDKPGVVFGDGPASVLATDAAGGDVLTVSAANARVSDLAFAASVTRTAGAYVRLAAKDTRLERFLMTGAATGVAIAAGVNRVQVADGVLTGTTLPASTAVVIEGGDNLGLRGLVVPVAGGFGTGIWLQACGRVVIEGCRIQQCSYGITIAPTAGQACHDVWVSACQIEACGLHSVRIAAHGAGAFVGRALFRGCRLVGAGGNGVDIAASSGGTVSWARLEHCFVMSNAANGLVLTGAGVVQSAMVGGSYALNGDAGILIGAGAATAEVSGAHIGQNNVGLHIDDGSYACRVIGNDLRGNIAYNFHDGSLAPKVIANNLT